jgi:proteasome accessory factor C
MPEPFDRLRRILLLIPYVQEHPGTRVRDLARYLGTDPRTLLADLDAVLLCGVPPYLPNDYIGVVLEGDRIYVSFAEHFKRPVNLTFEEALSLNLALRQLPLSRRDLETASELRKKILNLLPSGTRALWREARRQLQAGPALRDLHERLAVLEQAIEERRQVHVQYYTASRDAMTERDVRPYGLIEHNGAWYLIGHCRRRDLELPFRVDRIRRLRLLNGKFEVPNSFDIEKYRRPEMYFPTDRDLQVTLRIGPGLARWVREERPAGQLQSLPGGALLLHLSVSQPQWVVSWVMSHADQVELLAPKALRAEVAAACRKAAGQYAGSRSRNRRWK